MMMARPRLIKTTTIGGQVDDKIDDMESKDGDDDDGEGLSRCHHHQYACHVFVKKFNNNTMITIFAESRV